MITDVMFHSLRSRSQLIPVEDLIRDCAGSRMPEIIPELLTVPIATAAAEVCPTRAITTNTPVEGGCVLHLDYGKCIGCGRCVEVSDGAIRPAKRFSHSGVSRGELIQTWQTGSGSEAQAGETHTSARDRIYALLGRALNIRQLDPGSCNGCESEITALTNPYYDLERFGIHFVASPKHADMLLVTGPVTRNMELALRKAFEAMPEPRLVVAVGACGCSGGIFGSNYASLGGVDRVLPVDVYIPGCPPNPHALLHGILLAVGRGAQRSTSKSPHDAGH